jgi:hypothetical protein
VKRFLLGLLRGTVRLLVLLPAALATTALAVAEFPGAPAVAAVFAIEVVAVQFLVKGLLRSLAWTVGGTALIFAWFATLEPRNDREWQVDVSRPPRVTFQGDLVTIRDLRNFDWTGPDAAREAWEERTYDLSKLDSMWLALSYWDGNRDICHTVLSWGFEDGRFLALSVETRKEVGETYSAWRGFFKQYELSYVLADERDLLRVRTNRRGEDMYLYPSRASAARRRAVLEQTLRSAEAIATQPEWYGVLRENCTTVLAQLMDEAIGREPRFRTSLVFNGWIDKHAYDMGVIRNDVPYEEVRAAHRVTDAARAADADPDFSRKIRERIPPPLPPLPDR